MENFQISFSIVGSRAECQNSDRKDNPQKIPGVGNGGRAVLFIYRGLQRVWEGQEYRGHVMGGREAQYSVEDWLPLSVLFLRRDVLPWYPPGKESQGSAKQPWEIALLFSPHHHSTSPPWPGLSVALCGQVSWPCWYEWHILPSLWENGPSLAQPAGRRERPKYLGFNLLATAKPLGWLSQGRSHPQWLLQPHFFMSPHPIIESAAHTSHKGQNFQLVPWGKISKVLFFFFQGENWTNPSSTHPGSCPCFVGKGVGRAGGTGAAHLLGKRAVGGGQRQWWGGEPSPLCTPHSAPNSPSKEGILPLRASLIAQLVKNLPAMQETLVRFLSQEDPLEKD